MYRILSTSILFGMLLSVSSLAARGQDKAEPKKLPKKGSVFFVPSAPNGVEVLKKGEKPDANAAKERVVASGWIGGKLLSLDGTHMTVQYTWRYAVLNVEAYARLTQLYQDYLALYGTEDPDLAYQTYTAIAAEWPDVSKKLYDIHEKNFDYRLETNDEMKVRVAKLPPAVDAQGKRRAYSAKELQDLKGPGNLPGYIAKLDDLKVNQPVRAYCVKKKNPTDPNAVVKGQPYYLTATVIVILDDAPPEAKKEP